MLKAIIFDIDGTLAETEEAHRHAFNKAFIEFELGWHWNRSDYKRLLKVTGGKERISSFMDEIDFRSANNAAPDRFIIDLHRRKTEIYRAAIDAGEAELRPGVAALIEEACTEGLQLAIATTTSLCNIVSLVAATLGPGGLEMFQAVAAGDQVSAKKPAPDVYLKVIRDLDLQPENCLAIEDSTNGLRAAMAAGIATVITPSSYTNDDDFEGAALVTPTLAALRRSSKSGILPALRAAVS